MIRSATLFLALAKCGIVAADEGASGGDVVMLTGGNWKQSMEEKQYHLVKFYAPWCGHCKALAEPYKEAAKLLKEEGYSDVRIADLDATLDENKMLVDKLTIQGYPTLKWFNSQVKDSEGELVSEEYNENRTTDGIANFVRSKFVEKTGEDGQKTFVEKSFAVQVTEAQLAEKLQARTQGQAVFVFRGPPDFEKQADLVARQFKTLHATSYFVEAKGKHSVTIYKGLKEVEEASEADLGDDTKIVEWGVKARVPKFGQITEDNYEIYIEAAKHGMFWVCLNPENIADEVKKHSEMFVSLAWGETGSQYPFVWIDSAEFEQHAREELGCKTFPTIVLQKGDLLDDAQEAKVDQYVRAFDGSEGNAKRDEFNAAGIEKFFADVASGKLAPKPQPDELDELDAEDPEEPEEDLDDDMPGGSGDDEDLDEGDEDLNPPVEEDLDAEDSKEEL